MPINRSSRTRPIVAVAFIFVLALRLAIPGPAHGQESSGTAAARAELNRGKPALEAKDYTAAQAAFKRALEIDPAWTEAHSSYLKATRAVVAGHVVESGTNREVDAKTVELIRAQYEAWIAAHPKTAGYLWALGDALLETDRARAEGLCRKAVSVDPAFAPAYQTLARAASARGDMKARLEFLRRAAGAAPGTPSYQQSYISALWPVDPVRARNLSLQLAERFPSDPAAAKVLLWLAMHADEVSERVALLERIHRHPGTDLNSPMLLLYEAYVVLDLEKAGALAQEMIDKAPPGLSSRAWSQSLERQRQLVRVRSLVRQGRFADAVTAVDVALQSPTGKWIVTQNVSDAVTLEMTVSAAEAEAALGRNDRAYSRVLDLFMRQPGKRVHALVVRYGTALGKVLAAMNEDMRARLLAKAVPAQDFPILTYSDGLKGSLSDYRGKLVLLNFWFPT